MGVVVSVGQRRLGIGRYRFKAIFDSTSTKKNDLSVRYDGKLILKSLNQFRIWAPTKVAVTDDYFHMIHVVLFTSGHPYGPVYHFIWFVYELYVFYIVLYGCGLFYMCLLGHVLTTQLTHI